MSEHTPPHPPATPPTPPPAQRGRGRIVRWLSHTALALVSTTVPGLALAGTAQPVPSFGANPGNLKMYLYTPRDTPAHAPVVVALHGCTQTAAAFQKTGWNELADTLKFHVIYPEQQSSNNPALCFNWAGEYGDPANMVRGSGENQSIKSMVDHVVDQYAVDTSRIFVSGFSAGGAFAAVMLATWPDVFAAGAVAAGVPFRCADSVNGAYQCMSPGKNQTAEQWGALVRQLGYPGYTGPWPRVSIWHGTKDTTVVPMNATELSEQWTNVWGLATRDSTTESVPTPKGNHVHTSWADPTGLTAVEVWQVDGMQHGVALDPGDIASGGCGTAGAYMYDEDLCSIWHQAVFFGLDRSDQSAPTVVITSPTDGATVSGVVEIGATATDEEGVAQVSFLVDGKPVGSDSTPPYRYSWDTRGVVNGVHDIVARAVDTSGNTQEDLVSVTVQGGLVDTTPPTVSLVSPEEGETVGGIVPLLATAQDDFGVVEVAFLVDGEEVDVALALPWQAEWDSGSTDDGPHELTAQARDAAGHVTLSEATTVIVDNSVSPFSETFSNRGPDNPGWRLGGWKLSTADHSPGRSFSIMGQATASFGTTTQVASITLRLGDSPTLAYWRKLSLSAANTSARATFRVTVNGVVVDSRTVNGPGSAADATWQGRANLDLSAYANREVTLAFEVEATDPASILTTAQAWIDDITVSP